MTELEAAKRIVKQRNCGGVSCRDCPADGAKHGKKDCQEVKGGSLLDDDNEIAVAWFERYIATHETSSVPCIGEPVDAFESGAWYVWIGPKKRRPDWNGCSDGSGTGDMDFILDGKPHQCNKGSGSNASFFDSPRPSYVWSWHDGFSYFRKVAPPSSQAKLDVYAQLDTLVTAQASSRVAARQMQSPATRRRLDLLQRL